MEFNIKGTTIVKYSELFEKRYGWLTPSKAVVTCKWFGHLEALGKFPDVSEAYTIYENTIENNREFVNDCLSDLGPNEHPEMHRFDGIDDDARDLLIKTVYELGYIRLGIYRDYAIEAEGSPEGIRSSLTKLNAISKDISLPLHTRALRYVPYKGGSGYTVECVDI